MRSSNLISRTKLAYPELTEHFTGEVQLPAVSGLSAFQRAKRIAAVRSANFGSAYVCAGTEIE